MPADVTQVLHAIEHGDARAAEELLPLVYAELRRLAAQKLAHERPGQTLQPTALVHEAYVRLVASRDASAAGESGKHWAGRGHFFAAAGEAMRRILVENARRKKRIKHGGKLDRVELNDIVDHSADENVLALHEALENLAAEDPVAAQVVELRHYAGLGRQEIAAALGMTVYRVRQKWTYARAWLREAIGSSE